MPTRCSKMPPLVWPENLLVAMMSPQPSHELINVIAPAIEELVNAAAAVH